MKWNSYRIIYSYKKKTILITKRSVLSATFFIFFPPFILSFFICRVLFLHIWYVCVYMWFSILTLSVSLAVPPPKYIIHILDINKFFSDVIRWNRLKYASQDQINNINQRLLTSNVIYGISFIWFLRFTYSHTHALTHENK